VTGLAPAEKPAHCDTMIPIEVQRKAQWEVCFAGFFHALKDDGRVAALSLSEHFGAGFNAD